MTLTQSSWYDVIRSIVQWRICDDWVIDDWVVNDRRWRHQWNLLKCFGSNVQCIGGELESRSHYIIYFRCESLRTASNIFRVKRSPLRPHKINFLFPVPARITFGESIKKNFIFYFIEFDVFSTTINFFSVKADPFCPLC